MNARQVLLHLNKACDGNWDAMYRTIKNKEKLDDDEIQVNHSFLTIVDQEYPEKLKGTFKPPFTIFYDGDINLLNSDNLLMVIGNDKTPSRIVNAITRLSKSHVIASYYNNDFDKEILKACMGKNKKFLILTNKCLDDLDKDDEIIKYAIENKCLIITEYGFISGNDEYASHMRHRVIAPFLQGMLLASSVPNDPKVSLLVEAVCEKSGNVYVLPEIPFNNSFNNKLIKDGALLVDSISDIEIRCQ